MIKEKIFTIGLCCFITACSVKHSKNIPLEPTQKIMAFGDSLTYGYGGNNTNYPQVLSDLIKYPVLNYGVNGDTTAGGLNRLEEAIDKENPSLVILSLGGNDMLRSIPEDTIVKNLHSMIDILKAKNIKVILLAEPQPTIMHLFLGESLTLHDAAFYQQIAKEKDVTIINNVYSSLLSSKENKSDLVHLNEKGYIKVAQMLAKELKNENFIK